MIAKLPYTMLEKYTPVPDGIPWLVPALCGDADHDAQIRSSHELPMSTHVPASPS